MAADLGGRKVHLAVGGHDGQVHPTVFDVRVTDADPGDWLGAAAELGALVVDQVLDPLSAGTGPTSAEPLGRSRVVLVVESPAFSRGHQAHQMGAVHAEVINQARRAGYAAGHVHLNAVKKYVTGKGNAGKVLVVSTLAARTGTVFRSDDVADTTAIWCTAMELAGQHHALSGRVPRSHRQALEGASLPTLKGQP